MAASAKYLRFTKQAGTGVQSVTGVGFEGKALILWSTRRTSTGAGDGAQKLVGMTDGVDQMCRFINLPDNEAATTSAQSERTNRLVYMTDATSGATPTVQVEGDFDGFTADGFDLNWLTNDGTATIFHALVLGGSDVQVDYTPTKITVGAGGTIDVTTGFEPECFIAIGGAADEFGSGDYNNGAPYGSIHGFGFSNVTTNVCGWTLGRGTGGAADCARGQHTNRLTSIRVANVTGAAEMCGIHISAVSSTGYTITRDASTGSQPVQHILAIRGLRFALGSFSTPASASDYTLSLPFQPTVLLAQTHGLSGATGDGLSLAIGAWHESASGGTWIGGTDAANPSVYASAEYTDLVLQHRQPATTGSASTVDVEASVSSTSGDGAVLTFSAVPASAVQVIYIALAPSEGVSAGDDFTDGNPGPIAIATLIDKSGTAHPYSDVDGQNNRASYYDGYVEPRVLGFKPITRQLSGPYGAGEHVRFGVTVSDHDNALRAMLDHAVNKYMTNRALIVRTVSDADRRAELPQHTEMCGYLSGYSPREDFQFEFEGTDWIKKKLGRKTKAPEFWQVLLTRDDWEQLPDNMVNKAAPYAYSRLSDEVEGVALGDIPADLYPRGGYDPGWITFGRRGWGGGSFSPGDVWIWASVIKDGVESIVMMSTWFLMSVASPATQVVLRCGTLPDKFRFYISDSGDFHPVTNPLAGTYARYIDVDPADIPEGNNPYMGPDPADANNRFFLIDDPTVVNSDLGTGADYHALVSNGSGGTIDPAKGAAAPVYVGPTTNGGKTRETWIISYGAIDTVEGVFLGGERVTNVGSAYEVECPFLGDFATVFGANYITRNGRRWTPVYLTGQAAVDAINGTRKLTINRGGIESVGDTTGTRLDTHVDIARHFAKNFLAADTIPGGNWLTVAPTLPTGARMIDEASFDAVAAALAARVSGGYFAADTISATGEYESALDILASLARDGGFNWAFSRQGSLMLSVEPSSAPGDALAFDYVLHVTDRSFSIKVDSNQPFWNQWSFDHTKDHTGQTDTGWLLSGYVEDADSIDNYELEKPAQQWSMRWNRSGTTRGNATIIDVVQRARLRYRHPLRTAPFAIPYMAGGASIELGSVIQLTHVEGTGASGWSGRYVYVTKVEPDLNQWVTKFEGYDLQPIFDGLADAVEPTSQANGIRKDTITSLQKRVTDAQADVSAVQAQVNAIDAEVADHETRITALESGVLKVLTADPGSPVDDTAWLFDDGGSPANVVLRVRKGGTTYELPIGTLTS